MRLKKVRLGRVLVGVVAILQMFSVNFVYATGGMTVSTGSLSLTAGSTGSFTVTANNAAGRVDISSSDIGVARVSTGSEFLDNSSASVTVTGVKAGTATITVRATDMTTYDDEDVTGATRTVTVRVSDPAPKNDTPASDATPKNTNTTGSNSANSSSTSSGAAKTSNNTSKSTQASEPIAIEEVTEIVEEDTETNDAEDVELEDETSSMAATSETFGERQDGTIMMAVVALMEFVIIVAMLLGFYIWHRGRRRLETYQTKPQPETLLPPKAE